MYFSKSLFVTTLEGRYLPIPAIFDWGIAAILVEKRRLLALKNYANIKKLGRPPIFSIMNGLVLPNP
jgi:hypothetical protein